MIRLLLSRTLAKIVERFEFSSGKKLELEEDLVEPLQHTTLYSQEPLQYGQKGTQVHTTHDCDQPSYCGFSFNFILSFDFNFLQLLLRTPPLRARCSHFEGIRSGIGQMRLSLG